MVRVLSGLSLIAVMFSSCADGTVDRSEELVTTSDSGQYKMQVDVAVPDIAEGIANKYDLVRLSFAHGVATAEQLKREQITFISIQVFTNHLDSYFKDASLVPDQTVMSSKVQEIARRNKGDLSKLEGADRKVVEESVAAIFFAMFINHMSFKEIDVLQFKKGLTQAWEDQEIEAKQELLQSYFEYKDDFVKELGNQFLEQNKKREGVKETPSGLQYEVISESGEELEKPTEESEVTVHYHGELLSGKVFDSSYSRDETISFALNQVIPGWTEGLQLMSLGSKYRFYIPYNLAYGERGNQSIPGYSALIFDVELFEFN